MGMIAQIDKSNVTDNRTCMCFKVNVVICNLVSFFPGIVIYGDQSAAIERLVDCEKKEVFASRRTRTLERKGL